MKRGKLGIAAFIVSIGAVACGSTGSEFDDGQNPNAPANGVPGGADGLGEIGPNGTASACVTEVAAAALAPTNLVFMFDKSGSMGDSATGFDPQKRWVPVSTGLKQFFADPYSNTLRASMQFFPQGDLPNPSDTEAQDVQQECSYDYATPKVALTQASDAALVSAIDSMKPGGGTPTLPALQGALAYAKQVAADRPGDKTAVVLVTDGEPGYYMSGQFQPGCADNTVAGAAAAAKQGFEGTPAIPTYVIGVGPKLDNLDTIAQAGGTASAIMVDAADPTKTKGDIVAALDSIRRREVSCDFSIPPPPAGEELDTNAVNVVLKAIDGTEEVLGYSKDCASTDGWRYDDPAAPKRILLCSAACDDARASSLGQITIAFGCKTRVAVR